LAFQLNIRHNIEAAEDHFASGEVRTFTGTPVRVGRAGNCECCIEAPEFEPHHFSIDAEPPSGELVLHPAAGARVFVNGHEALTDTALQSGDEIRVEHWSLRVQKVYASAGCARHSDVLSVTARVLVAVILLLEIGAVVWLPRQLQSVTRWEEEIAKQRVFIILDALRGQNIRAQRGLAPEELEAGAREAIGEELSSLVRYIRANEERLGREDWRDLYEDVLRYQRILKRLREGQAFRPVPELDIEAGVRHLLARSGEPEPAYESRRP